MCATTSSASPSANAADVHLAARLTGWDIDILTPVEFTKGLEILSSTLLEIEGIEEAIVDRLAALGMISVFDLEEVGADVLTTELEIDEQVAASMVEVCAAKAKIVAEQQQRDKEEAEKRRREGDNSVSALLDGSAEGEAKPEAEGDEDATSQTEGGTESVSVDAILGSGAKDHSAEARAADILGQ